MEQKSKNFIFSLAVLLAMAALASPSLSLGSITLKDGLVAYYPFNGNANDESGNGNNGTVNGATLTEDNYGNASSAYSFDGVNDYISVPYNASKPLFNLENRFTYSLWFYANASGELTINQPLIGRQQCQKAYPSAELDLLKSEIAFTLNYQQSGTHKQFIPSQAVIPNQWTHIAGTYDKEAGLVNIYVNGENILSESYSQSIWKPATSFWIGGIPKPDNYSSCWETFFNGNIDNIRIYNRALSESEIEELYNSEGGNLSGSDSPNGISTVDANANPNTAPVYMGNIVNSGGVSTLSGKMELSVNFPAYNKPVDIWILIALPDGRFYTANESGKLLSFESGDLAAIASGVSGAKTEKKILTPFEIGASNTAFEPWPADGAWNVYWLVAPESNGDIFKAIENGNYELGFYSFTVKNGQGSEDEVLISTMVEPKNEVQYFDYNDTIALTLSEDIVDVPVILNVSRVKDFNVQPEDASLENVFNISLGEIKDLSGFIDIEIPYDPLKIPNGVDAEDFYGAIYLNENTNKWDQVAYRLDTSKNSIIINTDHLSKYATAIMNQDSIDSKSPMARSKPIYFFPITVYNTDIDKIKQVLNSMNSSGKAGNEGIKAAWENIGNAFGIANALLTFTDGMVEKLMVNNSLNVLNDVMGNVGIGIALYQLHLKLDTDYDQDRKNAWQAFYKDLGNWAIGRWDNPFMKIASLGVFAVDYSLNQFATTAIEGRYNMYVKAYNSYYQKGSTIPSSPFKVRSGVDWFKVFYDIVKKANSSEDPKTLIDTEIDNYVKAFWNDVDGMSNAFSELEQGFSYSGGDNPTLEKKISDNYKAELVNSYFQPIFRRLYTKIRIDNEQNLKNNEMKKVTDTLNQVYTINVTISGAEKVEGLPVKIMTMFNQDLWKGVTGKDGKWQMKCTLLGYINAGLPDKVVLSGAGAEGKDLEAAFELGEPSKPVEVVFNIEDEDIDNSNCYFKEGNIFDFYDVCLVGVNFKGCTNFTSGGMQVNIPFCFILGAGGTIIPKASCSIGENWYKLESLTGSWSCNSINLDFVTSGNLKTDPYFMDCYGACVDTKLKFTGTATITADSSGKLTSVGSGNVSQTYNYTNKCCPRTADGTVTCEKPFASQ